MTQPTDAAALFLQLHRPGQPLLLPNPWDIGSARVLASLGFEALATTSSGFAATLGLFDGSVTRDQAIGNAAQIVGAAPPPWPPRSKPGWPGARSRTSPGVRTSRSTKPGSRPSGWRPPPRRPTRG